MRHNISQSKRKEIDSTLNVKYIYQNKESGSIYFFKNLHNVYDSVKDAGWEVYYTIMIIKTPKK